jgi:hypothetical protein
VQGKKKRDAEATEAKRRADLAAQELESSDLAAPTAPSAAEVDESTAIDLLSSKDADVIF